MRGVIPATFAAGLVLVLAGCSVSFNQPQTANSPEATPSTPAVSTTPSTAPTPADSPTPSTASSPRPSPSPAKLIITSVNFHMGEVGLTYGTVTAGAAGGVKPYKWSIGSGALPPGLALSKAGGSTTGKPTAPGTFSFVIRVDDSAGGAAGVPRSIFVFRQIAFVDTSAICSSPRTTACKATLRYKGGVGGVVAAHITGIAPVPCPPILPCPQPPPGKPPYTPPPGFTATGSGGILTVSEPANCNSACPRAGGYWRLTLAITDSSACHSPGFICTSSNTAVVDVEMT
jgi:hypothetical protein